ncbi:uncharacterized protein LOC124150922 [Haliotis rufescens]|uniref:uncharacterized protein LOC124150922 n=1 Tax=Haliotis rufescens TaxID=6454 RepID=UPI00201ECDC4|nr:uncharacterized protein LOC124150922 [Haliotis rufescens]
MAAAEGDKEGSDTGPKLEDINGRLSVLYSLSVVKIVIGIVCFALGIPTIVYTAANPTYPFSSGSGIYTGIEVILTGMFGILTLNEAKSSDPARLRCLLITFRVFLSLGIDVGAVQFAYGIWSSVICFKGDGGTTCGGVHHSANSLLAVFNMIVGLTILVVCLVSTVVGWQPFKLFWKMGKVKDDVETIKA